MRTDFIEGDLIVLYYKYHLIIHSFEGEHSCWFLRLLRAMSMIVLTGVVFDKKIDSKINSIQGKKSHGNNE